MRIVFSLLFVVVMMTDSLSPLRLSPREGLDFVLRPKKKKVKSEKTEIDGLFSTCVKRGYNQEKQNS